MGKKYTLANGASLYAQNNSTEFQIAGSTGLLYSQGVPLSYYESVTAGSSEGSTMVPYGVTKIVATVGSNSSALTCYLGVPIPGVMKTIVVESTAALTGTLNVDLGANVTLAAGTSNIQSRYLVFSTAGEMQSATLIGFTTAKWGLVAANSTIGNFGVAGAITASSSFSS